ncbi:MAG: hypothetical protein GY847_12565 [Proteobacteria bacterium]|nr:hypothetical protein [Pseudomonadota bacterium]
MARSGRTALSDELTSCLATLQTDFTSVKGAPFDYFFCPILFRDEEAELCKGHILNKAFGIGMGKWTVQREDVDNFFGSRFESEITKVRHRGALGIRDVIGDRRLRQNLRPRVYAGNREIEFFIPQGEVPDHFTVLESSDEGLPPVIGIKVPPSEVEAAIDADWCIEVSLDLRVGFLVSLLKAAHLTEFYLLGYRYALSPAGHLIGAQMLGRVFEVARRMSRSEALGAAKVELADCINMVRPMIRNELDLRGTILDRQVMVAWSSSGFPWAIIIIVPVGDDFHGVMLPVGDHVSGITTWHSFMKNENDWIAVKLARFDREADQGMWKFSKKTWRIHWPKGATWADEE